MRLNNFFGLVVLLFLSGSCGTKDNAVFAAFDKWVQQKSILIISCNQCSCTITEMNKIYQADPGLLDQYDIYADPKCSGSLIFKDRILPKSQASIDSLSVDFYNVLVLKKKKGGIEHFFVETNNMKNLTKYLSD